RLLFDANKAEVQVRLHSTGAASRRTALLLAQIWPIFSLVAPCPAGASPVSVPRRLAPRAARRYGTDLSIRLKRATGWASDRPRRGMSAHKSPPSATRSPIPRSVNDR